MSVMPTNRQQLKTMEQEISEAVKGTRHPSLPPIPPLQTTAPEDYAQLQDPQRILRIGEQQAVVMDKVCSAVAKQFSEMIDEAKQCVSSLEEHERELLSGIKDMMQEQISEGRSRVQKLETDATRAAEWIAVEARRFAQHATEVANKLSMMQGKITASQQPSQTDNIDDAGRIFIAKRTAAIDEAKDATTKSAES